MFIGIPVLVFISLFFISEGYVGWTKAANSMLGTYQNKWLCDITYISVLIEISYININAFFNGNFRENKYKLVKFMKPRENTINEQLSNENTKGFKVLFYFLFITYLVFINIDLTPPPFF